jgi:hypothetical protein
MEQWYELEGIVSRVSYSDECDSLIWQYESSEDYSTSSQYVIINFGGVIPIHISDV